MALQALALSLLLSNGLLCIDGKRMTQEVGVDVVYATEHFQDAHAEEDSDSASGLRTWQKAVDSAKKFADEEAAKLKKKLHADLAGVSKDLEQFWDTLGPYNIALGCTDKANRNHGDCKGKKPMNEGQMLGGIRNLLTLHKAIKDKKEAFKTSVGGQALGLGTVFNEVKNHANAATKTWIARLKDTLHMKNAKVKQILTRVKSEVYGRDAKNSGIVTASVLEGESEEEIVADDDEEQAEDVVTEEERDAAEAWMTEDPKCKYCSWMGGQCKKTYAAAAKFPKNQQAQIAAFCARSCCSAHRKSTPPPGGCKNCFKCKKTYAAAAKFPANQQARLAAFCKNSCCKSSASLLESTAVDVAGHAGELAADADKKDVDEEAIDVADEADEADQLFALRS